METETANHPKRTEGRERRRKRERQRRQAAARRSRRILLALAALVCAAGVVGAAAHWSRSQSAKAESPAATVKKAAGKSQKAAAPAPPWETAATKKLDGEIVSKYAILIDQKTNTVLAEKNPDAIISPASMTKIMTVLVAAEHQSDLSALCPITTEVTDFCYRNGCSAVNFCSGEQVPVRDLFYGTILPSGADAAMTLANRAGGTQQGFVALMNAKLKALGLSKTAHFTNCVGIYNKNHHCTVRDMAMILQAALQNDLCRRVLSARTYTTASTAQHPQGLTVSNWFLRRIEDKDMGGITIQCAKTGYVRQSGSCAASYATDSSGNGYLCVTGMSTSSWRCIYDHVALYKQFAAARAAENAK